MAILYGTQSNGETLPVEVNEFGQLVAKGIDGQEGPQGPQGPPGIGQLPPDPYEGAVLGWQDGELAWVGKSIILPAGTYGPYTYLEDQAQLSVPQDVSDLLNGQQLFMSDDKGIQVTLAIATDLIKNVSNDANPVLTFPSSNNFNEFKVGDVAQSDWNQSEDWINRISLAEGTYYGGGTRGPENLFNGVISNLDPPGSGQFLEFGGESRAAIAVTPAFEALSGETIKVWVSSYTGYNPGKMIVNDATIDVPNIPPNNQAPVLVDTGVTSLNLLGCENQSIRFSGVVVDGKLLVAPSITNPNAVLITSIDPAGPTITTNGGSWYGTDGSGSFPNGDPDIRKVCSGEGSVEFGLGGVINLRSDNQEWVDDYYVTAPQQRIAARKVSKNLRRTEK